MSYMDKEIESHPEVKFYIATDDNGVKEEMRSKYGKRVITHEWDLRRCSVKGMQDAVAELYCLGHTNKILGSDHSTFSINASHLYDIPLVIVRNLS